MYNIIYNKNFNKFYHITLVWYQAIDIYYALDTWGTKVKNIVLFLSELSLSLENQHIHLQIKI